MGYLQKFKAPPHKLLIGYDGEQSNCMEFLAGTALGQTVKASISGDGTVHSPAPLTGWAQERHSVASMMSWSEHAPQTSV